MMLDKYSLGAQRGGPTPLASAMPMSLPMPNTFLSTSYRWSVARSCGKMSNRN